MFRFLAVTAFAISLAIAQTSIPKGSTEVEPGIWKHTDSAGKTTHYRKTPFGVVKIDPEKKSQEQDATQNTQTAAPAAGSTTPSPFGDVKAAGTQNIKVVDLGDTLQFERPSPFGGYKWKAKKSELTPEERAAWDNASAARKGSAAQKTAGSKE